jgi:hypothetical protein
VPNLKSWWWTKIASFIFSENQRYAILHWAIKEKTDYSLQRVDRVRSIHEIRIPYCLIRDSVANAGGEMTARIR